MIQLVPAGEGECERQLDKQIDDEGKAKTKQKDSGKEHREKEEDPASFLITEALADP